MSTVSTQYKLVKFYYVKFYLNIRLSTGFYLKHAVLNITHTEAMRIKADHLIIIKTVAVAFIIATKYPEHLLYIRCVMQCFTQISE